MQEVNQNVTNSTIENMAGRDIHINIFQNEKPFPRNQYVRDILTIRSLCKPFEIIINTHAEKSYGSRFFKEMPEKDLLEMHQFAQHLKASWEINQRPKFINWLLVKFKRWRA
ncbi:hypothetical protein N5918_01015 [Glaesserella parasuis]|nr:hypothetical protein HPSSW114_0385 [Glaesserella parasuis SW114]MCT8760706.1 hypothetical protein [Glaesserella parasuis]MCT8766824.1 hypothetical protein [Glaesserella parasuis]MDD2171704.1 hypothetical protein [Glaesserella parasuis]MDO9830565.1 hypothetical protein [Glaesserella parasuis]